MSLRRPIAQPASGNGDSEPLVTVFTNTLTKGESDHVNHFYRNRGTDFKLAKPECR